MSEGVLTDAYEKAKATLINNEGRPTPHYENYLKYEDEWNTKKKAYETAYAAASTDAMILQRWPIEGLSYRSEVDSAWNKWIALGFKNEIETAIATIEAQGKNIKDIISNKP